MAVADTTVLVALFDESHEARNQVLRQFGDATVVHVPSVVLSELMLVLRKLAKDQGHDGNGFARSCLVALMAKRGIEERQDYDAVAARSLFLRHPTLSYVDAVCIVTARSLEDDLLTLDKEQKKVWKAQKSA